LLKNDNHISNAITPTSAMGTFETVSESRMSNFGCLVLIREQVTLDETIEMTYTDEQSWASVSARLQLMRKFVVKLATYGGI
jgi:hypothetical protein